MQDKTHSSGLLDYQVDDVRRRFRAGKPGKAGKDADSAKAHEPVKEVERIDETSGEKLTERRIGQTVIRRRKKAEAEPEAAEALTEETPHAPSVPEAHPPEELVPPGEPGGDTSENESAVEAVTSEENPVGEPVEQKIVFKKPIFKGKETIPASILGRIDLKPKHDRAPEQPAQPVRPTKPEAPVKTPIDQPGLVRKP